MAQHTKDEGRILMSTHLGCTTGDLYLTDSSILRYYPSGATEAISVEEAIKDNTYTAGENVEINDRKEISVSFDFGTYF